MLSDITIEALCFSYMPMIYPFDKSLLQPASYDVTLDEPVEHWLSPREFILASTIEDFVIPENIVGRLEGKSSLARKGLIIHTAGFIDPGFKGTLTLEITNLSSVSIHIKRGMRIAQVAFSYLDQSCARPYGHFELNSHYQGQRGIRGAHND